MTKQTIGTLTIVASAAGFATLAILIKFAYAAGANAITILSARFLIAALFLGLLLKKRGISLYVGKKIGLQLFLLGALGYGNMALLFASSLNYLPASLTAMLLYAYPTLVTLMSFVLGNERFSFKKGSALFISFVGLILVLGVSYNEIHPVGVFLGLGSAFIYACYIIIGNRLLKDVTPLVTTIYVCASAAIFFILIGLVTGDLLFNLPLQGWLAMLAIAVFPTIIGILGFFSGSAHIGATNASIISTVEPLITVILAAILLNESITLAQALGGVLIITGIVILQVWSKHPADSSGESKSIFKKVG
ncbi:MAG: carboxylate/amino acid/amine transporter [Firmicutes bacterium]|nr:carboxylate/amino acid/amine transporter [Bacillota bacterium]